MDLIPVNNRNLCFLIPVLVSIVLAAGCASTDSQSPPATAELAETTHPAGTSTPDVTTPLLPSPVASFASCETTATPVPVRIFNGEYHWAEYRINNTITLPPNPRYQWEYRARIERSYEDHNGIPAVHEKTTITGDDSDWKNGILVTTKNGFHATEDTYYERATKRFLGGIYTGDGGGLDNYTETVPGDEVYREDHEWGWLLISPFEEMNNPLYPEGVESVIVPAGTYKDARKYSGKFHNLPGFPVTFWVSDNVPIPVQYRISNPGLGGEDPVQTFELMSWG